MTKFVTPKIINFDLDDVLAEVIEGMVTWYNNEWNDTLTTAHITKWNIAECVKPECGKKVYNFFRTTRMYDTVVPTEGAQHLVNTLQCHNWHVRIVTSTWQAEAGRLWVEKHFPSISDYVYTKDKTGVDGDYLVDDKPANVIPWGIRGILYDRHHNQDHTGLACRVRSMQELGEYLGVYDDYGILGRY